MNRGCLDGDGRGSGEEPGYLDVGRERLFFVRHRAQGRARARVLLLGPFASERIHVYGSWVRWARLLASRGMEVVRFDYRGVGESTGRFEEMSLPVWHEDACVLMDSLAGEEAGIPLVLHGVRFGAVMAEDCFAEGRGNALLLWSPVPSLREHCREILRAKLAEDLSLGVRGPRKRRADYIAELEAGGTVEVEGYVWSGRFWKDVCEHARMAVVESVERPVKRVSFVRNGRNCDTAGDGEWVLPLTWPPFWTEQNRRMLPDLSELYTRSLGWLDGVLKRIAVP